MWKSINGKLIHTTDSTRIKFRTNVSKSIIDKLNALAIEHDTHPNYLIESGLRNVLNHGSITYNKETRPKDRIQYKTTYDKDLLNNVKKFANEQNLYINDVIEYSTNYIDFENIRYRSYKHRIE